MPFTAKLFRTALLLTLLTGFVSPVFAADAAVSEHTVPEHIAELIKTLEKTYPSDFFRTNRNAPNPRRDAILSILEKLKGQNPQNACFITTHIAALIDRWQHILILTKALEVMEGYSPALNQNCRDELVRAYMAFVKNQDKNRIMQFNATHSGHSPSVWDFAGDEEVAGLKKRFERLICAKPVKPGARKWEYIEAGYTGMQYDAQHLVCEAGGT